jgi:hypothetical protein
LDSDSWFFFPRLKVFEDLIAGREGPSESVDALTKLSASLAFFFVRNRFILLLLDTSAASSEMTLVMKCGFEGFDFEKELTATIVGEHAHNLDLSLST